MTEIMSDAIRDVSLHTGIDPSIVQKVFKRLVLDDDLSYDPDTGFSFAFGLRPYAETAEELREKMSDLSTTIGTLNAERDGARESLDAAFFPLSLRSTRLTKAQKASLEYVIDMLS